MSSDKSEKCCGVVHEIEHLAESYQNKHLAYISECVRQNGSEKFLEAIRQHNNKSRYIRFLTSKTCIENTMTEKKELFTMFKRDPHMNRPAFMTNMYLLSECMQYTWNDEDPLVLYRGSFTSHNPRTSLTFLSTSERKETAMNFVQGESVLLEFHVYKGAPLIPTLLVSSSGNPEYEVLLPPSFMGDYVEIKKNVFKLSSFDDSPLTNTE